MLLRSSNAHPENLQVKRTVQCQEKALIMEGAGEEGHHEHIPVKGTVLCHCGRRRQWRLGFKEQPIHSVEN